MQELINTTGLVPVTDSKVKENNGLQEGELDFWVNTKLFLPNTNRDFMQVVVSKDPNHLKNKTLEILKQFLLIKQEDIKANIHDNFKKNRILVATDNYYLFHKFFKEHLTFFVESGLLHFFEKSEDDPMLDLMKFRGKYDFIILNPLVPDCLRHLIPFNPKGKPDFLAYVGQHLKTNPDVCIFATASFEQYTNIH